MINEQNKLGTSSTLVRIALTLAFGLGIALIGFMILNNIPVVAATMSLNNVTVLGLQFVSLVVVIRSYIKSMQL